MKIALITGAAGLIGSEATKFFSEKGFSIVGIDNNMREYFFGKEASTQWKKQELENSISDYKHYNADIRDKNAIEDIFKEYSSDIKIIIHTAAQPSHDWAALEPFTDFGVNALGTLNMLEMTRQYCKEAPFIFTSTNKVYGDRPNTLPLIEKETRWDVEDSHPYYNTGINEQMSIDQSLHSLFGASKVAADVLVQEYGKYFGMNTVCFRGGCLTGPSHSGTKLHGFLAYLVKCVVTGEQYNIMGYKGKQVRDNIHSFDLVNAFWNFYNNPKQGEVYNIGGSTYSNCSMIEAINLIEKISGKKLYSTYTDTNRTGDHIWWISDVSKFKSHYPEWNLTYNVEIILQEIYTNLTQRL